MLGPVGSRGSGAGTGGRDPGGCEDGQPKVEAKEDGDSRKDADPTLRCEAEGKPGESRARSERNASEAEGKPGESRTRSERNASEARSA